MRLLPNWLKFRSDGIPESLGDPSKPVEQPDVCGNCRYATVDTSRATQHGHGVICREGPHFEQKTQHDWCGKHQPKKGA